MARCGKRVLGPRRMRLIPCVLYLQAPMAEEALEATIEIGGDEVAQLTREGYPGIHQRRTELLRWDRGCWPVAWVASFG
jgi:hypothetical protein